MESDGRISQVYFFDATRSGLIEMIELSYICVAALFCRAYDKRFRGFYEKSDAKKSQWIKCVKSDILELNNGVIRLFIRERIQNNYIFTCILKGRDEYSLKGKVSWIIEMCV